ncbi:RNA-directed DNA polymerase [Achromobacter piechaudii]|nr:RNA-directed DNA polymerase [Achromobacter piechaudii]
MAGIKFGDPFGLDATLLKKLNWDQALKRVAHDQRSDFIYAPHFGIIYAKAGDELVELVNSELKSGKYLPGMPITLEVPKSGRMRAVSMNRQGPSFSRPGSILWPKDRLVYQLLADEAAPIIEKKTDKTRSFSHRLAAPDQAPMFAPTRTCWNALQQALARHSKKSGSKYILRIDVANYFGSINQHTFINDLTGAGYPKTLADRLEVMLVAYTEERSSRGILQGMYPSDLFGNYYMDPIDRFLKEYPVPSARYVDDLYIFIRSVDEAEDLLRQLVPLLRAYDLVLNEAKSAIMPKNALMSEEPDLETLFEEALDEISSQVADEDFDADYGFQSEWDEDDDEEEEGSVDIKLEATKHLFNSISKYPGHEENIERFCLPLFATIESDYAVDHVLNSFKKRPSMSQIYAAYLARFLDHDGVSDYLIELLSDASIMDWQKMWILAALLQGSGNDNAVKVVNQILTDTKRRDVLRAIAAIYVGKFGDHARRKSLRLLYPSCSPYVQLAIYFSSRYWSGADKKNARDAWGASSAMHSLLTSALSKRQ